MRSDFIIQHLRLILSLKLDDLIVSDSCICEPRTFCSILMEHGMTTISLKVEAVNGCQLVTFLASLLDPFPPRPSACGIAAMCRWDAVSILLPLVLLLGDQGWLRWVQGDFFPPIKTTMEKNKLYNPDLVLDLCMNWGLQFFGVFDTFDITSTLKSWNIRMKGPHYNGISLQPPVTCQLQVRLGLATMTALGGSIPNLRTSETW